jgi:dihydroxyacetone kinase-like predicted kinase
MKADVEPYIDEWIAIVDNKIVSHGKNVKEVLKEAEKMSPGKKFLVTRVPGKEIMIL